MVARIEGLASEPIRATPRKMPKVEGDRVEESMKKAENGHMVLALLP